MTAFEVLPHEFKLEHVEPLLFVSLPAAMSCDGKPELFGHTAALGKKSPLYFCMTGTLYWKEHKLQCRNKKKCAKIQAFVLEVLPISKQSVTNSTHLLLVFQKCCLKSRQNLQNPTGIFSRRATVCFLQKFFTR